MTPAGHNRRHWVYPVVSPLIIATPFVGFIKFHDYGYLSPEILLILGGLTGVGLLLGFLSLLGGTALRSSVIGLLLFLAADIQFDWGDLASAPLALFYAAAAVWAWTRRTHVAEVTAAVLGTILLSTVLLPFGQTSVGSAATVTTPPGPSELPPVLHIVLDEHAGIEGISTAVAGGEALRQRLRSFYETHGFRLYGRAYSRYADTLASLGHTANLLDTTVVEPTDLFERDGPNFRLKRNDYFKRLQETGYRLHIYQTRYLDFCNGLDARRSTCQTANSNDLRAIRDSNLLSGEKAFTIVKLYLERSLVYDGLRTTYGVGQNVARRNGIMLPLWKVEKFRVSSVSAVKVLKDLESAVSGASAGDYYFAHVLLPHYPYALGSDCGILSPKTWLNRESLYVPGRLGFASDMAFAHNLHQRYHRQIECLYAILGNIMDGIARSNLAERFVVILQGDHGSKIQSPLPVVENAAGLSRHHFVQNYSTLFAVKAPGITPGYSEERRAVQELFKTFVENDFASLAAPGANSEKPFVYVSEIDDPLAYGAQAVPFTGF